MGGLRLASTFRGGIRINDHKTTKYSKTVDMPAPAVVHIPLPKQSDIPFTLSVKEGQNVFKGQIIAFSGDGYRSIHATVSGKVRHIEAFLDKNGIPVLFDQRRLRGPANRQWLWRVYLH